jgi:hypothetical protein
MMRRTSPTALTDSSLLSVTQPTLPDGRPSPIDAWGAFCQLYVVAVAGVAVAVASRFRNFLDEKFTLDAIWIQSTLNIPDASLDPADPFRNAAFVYRMLGLANLPDVAAMAPIAVFGVALIAAIRWSELPRLTPLGLAAISVCYVLALIYLAQYSKEFVSLLVVALVLLLPRGGIPEVVLVGAMVSYAITIRPYWGIVVVLYVVGRILLPRVRGLIPVLIFVVVTYGCLQVAFNRFLGEALSFSRVAVNSLRADINISVGSLIVDFLPDEVALQWLNAFLVFLSLLFPWPLILAGSPTYVVMAVVLGFLWGLVAWSILQIQRERAAIRRGRHAQSARRAPLGGAVRALLTERTPRPERAVALLLALVIVQAIFEPDYGSYVKHMVPALPLFLTLLPLTARRSPNHITPGSAEPGIFTGPKGEPR